ncbi:MAG TPA: hypothetical protein VGJ97_10950 [Anaerolineaceae bacterium]
MEGPGSLMEAVSADLTQKIDALAAQVAYLTEQAQAAERERESRAELLETVIPISRDALRMAAEQMEEVQDYLDPEDLVRLLKKLIRLGPAFETLLDQVDSLTDLVEVMGPITKEGVDKASALMGELERKGYFTFARGGMRMAKNVVASFNEEDVNHLGDNIVLILNTVKDMTQPEILTFVRNTLLVAEKEVEKPVDISTMALLRQINDPGVRRGLALTMRVLHVIGQTPALPAGTQ